jgi:hypothetical protein
VAWCVTASASEPARQTGQLPPASAVEVEVRFFIAVEARPLHIEKQCLFIMCHLQDDPDAIGEHVGVHGEGMLVFTASTG